MAARRVVALATERRLICCWQVKSVWCWRSVDWPSDACVGGMPAQRDAMGEMLAELLFESDVIGAQLELLLPLDGVDWRVLDGVQSDFVDSVLADRDQSLQWPLNPLESYSCVSSCSDGLLAIGVSRSMLLSWIDMVEQADLPLRRVDWILMSALRTINYLTVDRARQVAWLFPHGSALRLVLIQDGVPEVDHIFSMADKPLNIVMSEVRRTVSAWQQLMNVRGMLGWWFSFPDSLQQSFMELIDIDRDERLLNQVFDGNIELSDGLHGDEPLEPLEHLALLGMLKEMT